MATFNYLLRTQSNPKKGYIYAQISCGQNRTYYSLGIQVQCKYWNAKAQRLKHSGNKSDQSGSINSILDQIEYKAKQTIGKLESEYMLAKIKNKPLLPITATQIKSEIFPKDEKNPNQIFIKFAEKHLQNINPETHYNSYKKTRSEISIFKDFLEKKYNTQLTFSQISVSLVKEFFEFRLKKVSQNSANRNIVEMNVIFNKAIEQELIPPQVSPFSVLKLKNQPTDKIPLYEPEIYRIIELNLTPGSLIWHVRNYFLFQIYTGGLRVGDLCCISKTAIINDRLSYKRLKTNTHISTRLVPQAKEILNYYLKDGREAIFPIMDQDLSAYKTPGSTNFNDKLLKQQISKKTALINKYLKKIATQANIQKNISSHIARHTFANLAAAGGWDIYTIKDALGHTDIQVTQKYMAHFKSDQLKTHMTELFKGFKTVA